jgi:YHS domain-containing protein
MRRISLLVAAFGLMLTAVVADEVKLDGIKCIMNPKAAAKADKTVDYKGGKVYFCCDNCPKGFAKDQAGDKKMSTKANTQLVATGQAKQAKCPLSGGDLDKDTEITVAGAKVSFCCNNCKGKVEKLKGDEQADAVFGDKAFEKAGFKVEKAKTN